MGRNRRGNRTMNRYKVILKKSVTSKESISIYIRAYSMSQIVDMFNDEYFLDVELKEKEEDLEDE